MTESFAWRSQRRHRLCPNCGFDLAGALDAGVDRCPECGERFTYEQLVRERRPGDWSVAVGYRRLAVALLWRGAALFLVWLTVLAALLPGYGQLAVLAAVVLGVAAGKLWFARVQDVAGVQSPLVLILTALAIVAAFAGGLYVAALLGDVMPMFLASMSVVAGATPAVYFVVHASLDE